MNSVIIMILVGCYHSKGCLDQHISYQLEAFIPVNDDRNLSTMSSRLIYCKYTNCFFSAICFV